MTPERQRPPDLEAQMSGKPDNSREVEYSKSFLAELKEAAAMLSTDREASRIRLNNNQILIREEDSNKPEFAAWRPVDYPEIDGGSFVLYEGSPPTR